MGRLIDADEWVQELRTQMSDKDCPGEIQDYCLFMINEINTRPTAYDVKKVVEEFDKQIQSLDNKNKICMDAGHFQSSDRLADRMCEVIKCKEIVKNAVTPAAVQEEGADSV